MGYIGQHLVSVVTGYPGGGSGARGDDLVLSNGGKGEIKTCYRVDQLGKCLNKSCGATITSIESECPACHGTLIKRNNDSKWLLAVKTDKDFEEVLQPERYYLVLFEFEDIGKNALDAIVAYIWEVNPTAPGFAYCMIDYKLNIQSNSKSGAPFNLWPWSPKFYMMKPKLIYQAVIHGENVETLVFPKDPAVPGPVYTPFPDLVSQVGKDTITPEALQRVAKELHLSTSGSKKELAARIENARRAIPNDQFCDLLAKAIYTPLIQQRMHLVPKAVLDRTPPL